MHNQLEVERKFTVDEDFDLTSVRLSDRTRLVHDGVFQLRATYYDAADLRLIAEGITLRRRTGGPDDGWQLKLPHGPDGREEVHEPAAAGETEPPASLRGLVLAHLRGETLRPVAQITTSRVVHRLVGDERGGPVLAELVDDHVTAEVCGDEAISTAWREVEAELVEGDADLLRAVTAALERAGASRAVAGSKLERALGGRVPPRRQAPADLGRDSDAAAVALAYLRQQVAAITAADPLVRLDAEDAVHQMRVASRRLRAALTTFRPHLARGHTDALRGELRWLAGLLGDVRDAEVLRDRLRDRFDAAPAGPGTAAARARVDAGLSRRYDHARAEMLHQLASPRYLRLLDDLDGLLDAPPLTPRARRPAREELPGRARKAWKALRRAHQAADAAVTPGERATALHEVRKAAKRARYTGEALQPAFGKDAARFAAAMERVQEVLGEHQDSQVARETLAEMAAQAYGAGEDTFAYGFVAGLEEAAAAAARSTYGDAWRAASRQKLHRWTRS